MFGRRNSRSGRPSLLRTTARTAVVAGTAQSVAGKVAQRQADQAAANSQPAAEQTAGDPPPDSPVDMNQLIEQLKQLGELHQAGVLTDEEFAAQKNRLMP